MPIRTAIIVSGPESSGNKLLRNILVSSGLTDISETPHIKDVKLGFVGDSKVVWLRSCPHACEMPDYSLMAKLLRNSGYQVYALVPLRDWSFTVESQYDRGHIGSIGEAILNLVHTYSTIFSSLSTCGVKFVPILYPDLTADPIRTVSRNLKLLGLDTQIQVACDFETENRDFRRLVIYPDIQLFFPF